MVEARWPLSLPMTVGDVAVGSTEDVKDAGRDEADKLWTVMVLLSRVVVDTAVKLGLDTVALVFFVVVDESEESLSVVVESFAAFAALILFLTTAEGDEGAALESTFLIRFLGARRCFFIVFELLS